MAPSVRWNTDAGWKRGGPGQVRSLGQAGCEVNDLRLEVGGQPIQDVGGLAQMATSTRRGGEATPRALERRSGRSGHVQVTAE
jgi:hypothetical protein